MTAELAFTIEAAIAALPVPKRGPRTSLIRRALGGRTDFENCWAWPGWVGSEGYGVAVRPGTRRKTTAQRVIWEVLFGPIESGMQVDHLCHDPNECNLGNDCPHRRCVNPSHLGLATPLGNTLRGNSFAAINARKSRCDHGHEFTPENTYVNPAGRRTCRTCTRVHWRRYDAIRRSAS